MNAMGVQGVPRNTPEGQRLFAQFKLNLRLMVRNDGAPADGQPALAQQAGQNQPSGVLGIYLNENASFFYLYINRSCNRTRRRCKCPRTTCFGTASCSKPTGRRSFVHPCIDGPRTRTSTKKKTPNDSFDVHPLFFTKLSLVTISVQS